MESLTSSLIEILQYLLPGFLTAWIFYGFTSFSKPSQFERVVQALIFTLVVQTISYLCKATTIYLSKFYVISVWNQDLELILSLFIATILGFIFSYFANNDKFHKLIRKIHISKETSYPSEWYGVFSKNKAYVVLHFDDGRRLYGWPTEWPSNPETGHFSIQQASWLDEMNKETKLVTVEAILIPVKSVIMVEFMVMEALNVEEIPESTTLDSMEPKS